MKKFSLLLSAFAVSLAASAQYQACFMDASALGFEGGVDDPAGTVLCEDENGKLTLAFTDDMKAFTPSAAPYTYVAFEGGEAMKIPAGCTGSTNGKSPLTAGVAQMIDGGCVYKLETTKTGYFFFLTKMNTNKNYYVMEGQNNLLAYALGIAIDPKGAKNTVGVDKIYYTLPEDVFGNVDMAATNASDYLDGDAPEFTKIKTPGATMGYGDIGEGSGFLCIASYATEEYPSTFYYWAQGSKMANNGFIYVPAEEPTLEEIPFIEFSGVETTDKEGDPVPAPTPVAFGSTAAVSNISAANSENAPIYNLFGQQVGKDAKGILIQNGKKFIRK